jgi:hypothetical protein
MTEEFKVDFSNYKERVGGRVIPGRYRVIVDDAEVDTAKSGNTMINLWLRVQGGEFDGTTIIDRLVLTDKSLFRVHGFMEAIGLPTPKKAFSVKLAQFRGKTLEVDVEDGDPYNNRVKSEVRGYLRITKARGEQQGPAPADLDDLEALAEFDPKTTSNPVTVEEAFAKDEPPADEVDLDKLDLG